MNCFSDFIYSLYADGELPAEEMRSVEAHTAGCPRCRNLVGALRAENQMLREALSQVEAEAVSLPAFAAPPKSGAFWGALVAMLASLAGLRIALGGLFDLPSPIEWLNPFSLNAQLEIFFRTVFYLLDEGASMLLLGLTTLSILILMLLAGLATLLLRRRQAFTAVMNMALGVVLLLGCASPASAVDIRHGEHIIVPAGQTLNDSLVAGGAAVTIEGTVTGNVIAAARRVIIKGTVEGDVFCGAQSVDVDGTVGGNLVVGGQFVNIRGKVNGTIHAFSDLFRLFPEASAGGDLLAFAAVSQVEGAVVRDVMMFGAVSEARGKIGRNLTVRGDRLRVASTASVGGDLTARLRAVANADIDPGAAIAGKRDIRQAERRRSGFSSPWFYLWQVAQFIGALLVAAILLALFPGFYRAAVADVGSSLRSLGLGFAICFAAPIAIVLVGITIVGLPLAAAALFVYVAGLYLSKILVGAYFGQALLKKPLDTTADALSAALLGLLIFFVIVNVPYIGGLFHLVVFCLGLGAFAYRLYAGLRTA